MPLASKNTPLVSSGAPWSPTDLVIKALTHLLSKTGELVLNTNDYCRTQLDWIVTACL